MVLEDRDIQYLKRHLLRNNVTLFLGAGFSMSALNLLGEHLPSSKELAKALWRYMNYPGDHDGTSLSILYQAALRKPGGTDPLFSLLRSKLIVKEYPEWYSLITRWFWYRIYTINVDNLVELIFKESGGHIKLDPVVAPSEYQDRDAFLRSIQLVKLNGSLDHLDLGLTFAPKEYGRRAAEQDVWYDHFVRDFSTSPTLIVGSELDEPLFWQYIAIRQRRSRHGEKRAKSFLICPSISPAKREALSEYNVTPIETTAEEFFQELASQPDTIISRQELLQNLDPSLEEVIALEKMGLAAPEVELAEEFFRVFRPVKPERATTGTRSHFLLGSPPSWTDIFNHLDADREVNLLVRKTIANELLNKQNDCGLIVLTGAAGSGKTTIAKRVSITIAGDGFSVYWTDAATRFLPEQVISYLRNYDRRVVLVFDDAAADLRRICDLAARCSTLKCKPVMLLVIRANDVATKRYMFEGLRTVEVRVPDLSEYDINGILETLEAHGLLGELRKVQPRVRVEIFRNKARKQILVAMREATKGLGFNQIIEDEYDKIEPKDAKLIYLIAAIPSMFHHTIDRGQLVAAADLSPSEVLGIIDDSLSGILIPREDNLNRLQVRHPVIAEFVVREVAPRDFLAQAYIAYLQILAHDLPPLKDRKRSRTFRVYQEVVSHRNLHEVFLKQVELCRNIYESIKPQFVDDGHYMLQYGSYELEWGDLDFAENYLLQAESLMPNHPWVATAISYLLMRKAVEATSPLAANELIAKGIEKVEQRIALDGDRDPYPFHVLGSQMLAFINRWCPYDERIKRLQELSARIQVGYEKHPLDGQLRQLLEDIKRAELNTTTSW
jgi:hypothetical protein